MASEATIRPPSLPEVHGTIAVSGSRNPLRRIVTRLIAIVPVLIVARLRGDSGTAQMLILSQVVLSPQLLFAVVPLVRFTTDRELMGARVAPRWVAVLAWIVTAVIISLNMKLLFDVASGA